MEYHVEMRIMKVVLSSLIAIIITVMICDFYVMPNVIKHTLADNLKNMIMVRKLFDENKTKAINFLNGVIMNSIVVLEADNNNIIGVSGLLYMLKHTSKEEFCNSDIINENKGNEIMEFCRNKEVQGDK